MAEAITFTPDEVKFVMERRERKVKAAHKNKAMWLRLSVAALLDAYKGIANSYDAGTWNVEKDPVYTDVVAALEANKPRKRIRRAA